MLAEEVLRSVTKTVLVVAFPFYSMILCLAFSLRLLTSWVMERRTCSNCWYLACRSKSFTGKTSPPPCDALRRTHRMNSYCMRLLRCLRYSSCSSSSSSFLMWMGSATLNETISNGYNFPLTLICRWYSARICCSFSFVISTGSRSMRIEKSEALTVMRLVQISTNC